MLVSPRRVFQNNLKGHLPCLKVPIYRESSHRSTQSNPITYERICKSLENNIQVQLVSTQLGGPGLPQARTQGRKGARPQTTNCGVSHVASFIFLEDPDDDKDNKPLKDL